MKTAKKKKLEFGGQAARNRDSIDENYEPTTEDFEERNDAMNQNARVK